MLYKVVLLGQDGVGKTSLTQQLHVNHFTKTVWVPQPVFLNNIPYTDPYSMILPWKRATGNK
jgi:GTPase SAR1 family protein